MFSPSKPRWTSADSVVLATLIVVTLVMLWVDMVLLTLGWIGRLYALLSVGLLAMAWRDAWRWWRRTHAH